MSAVEVADGIQIPSDPQSPHLSETCGLGVESSEATESPKVNQPSVGPQVLCNYPTSPEVLKSVKASAVNGPKCAIYLRVSTSEQTTAGQKPDISALVAARGYQVVETYEEQASAVKHRPGMDRLMADAAAGKFSVVVVWALDRFGRSLQGNINAILALDGLGVTVVSVREPWLDTAGPVRGLLVAIFSWVAQQERTRLIERTKAGIAVARAGGVKWGRKSVAALLLPGAEAERDRVMAEWDAGGQVGGFKALGVLLGGCSHNTARRLWEQTKRT